jgi:2,3-bisphosphoglycerate-dependent phosphoglycerate mutase
MSTLLIARHGNTFESYETPRRVGKRTDLPLTAKGLEQAHALGRYLQEHKIIPTQIITSSLQRTKQMATIIQLYLDTACDVIEDSRFDEIDYGIDENKTEEEVLQRIGTQALEAWNDHGILPNGWYANLDLIHGAWRDVAEQSKNSTIFVITSNGIARFAPSLTGDEVAFRKKNPLKMSTGALSIFTRDESQKNWICNLWNFRPS